MRPVSNKNESIRLFNNGFLEFFSHIHPATPFVVFVPVVLYFLFTAHQSQPFYIAVPLWSLGVLMWTLLEYTLHRFVFHWDAKSPLGKRFVFLLHGVHHDYPRDATRLVMPLLVSVPLAFFFYFLFQSLFAPYHEGLFAGLVSGYLAYDFSHFAFHHFQMRGPIATYLKICHLKHHYSDPNTGFGVSSPLWDFIFRTMSKDVTNKEEWSELTTA